MFQVCGRIFNSDVSGSRIHYGDGVVVEGVDIVLLLCSHGGNGGRFW